MILKSDTPNQAKVNKLLGAPYKFSFKNHHNSGTASLFLKEYNSTSRFLEGLTIGSKCNFELRPKGLLLHVSLQNQYQQIPIPFSEIKKLEIEKGAESIKPIPMFPMWILLKLGLSIRYARYFRLKAWEYTISELKLRLITELYDMSFQSNGYNYIALAQYFKWSNLNPDLIVLKKTS
ncbi:hypothetical protein [Croceimicrobium sp.]|uniref:hypothetical protein n=1 Tax=Croceimicrobium sp. TaxID=2828340 RepID=UPI003BACD884